MRGLTLTASTAMVWLAVSTSALVGITSSIPEASSAALLQTEAARNSVLAHENVVAKLSTPQATPMMQIQALQPSLQPATPRPAE